MIAGGWLRFYRIGNTIVVTVEVEVVLDAVAIGIDGGIAKLIPDSVSIGIGQSCGGCFGGRDISVHVGVCRDRNGVTAFMKIADAVVVAVEVTVVANTITVSVCGNNWDEGKRFVDDATGMD